MTSPRSNVPTRDPRRWLTRYLNVQTDIDRTLIQELERASRDAAARINALRGARSISARVERTQLMSVRNEMHRVIAELWERIGDLTRAGQARAAVAATDMGWEWDQFLFTRVGMTNAELVAMRASLEGTASRNVEAALQRITRGRVPLSARVYRSREFTTGLVDRRINSALARGLNHRQFANEMRDTIRPDVAGGVSYAAKRLARTEINAAYHAISATQNADKPWNTGMGWNLSRSHPSPDICNLYADRSPYALHEVPGKPHPQCLCYIVPETVTPEEFVNNWRSGRYDEYMAANYGRRGQQVA